ncbi:hypothetical protein BESB_065990 [Besnoitia besnoiti]|uniref:Transmembrane protein n=1 Tax=Besnoitia besnoiti TaxID=94643 RepID=A0A2A9MF43_BESBE|nr:hypothetical protein BESB_065990 [Besnoitia besnoiti]PFH34566.1 hypothetical protein BESB_065990 [Besnoitia besnoiti]
MSRVLIATGALTALSFCGCGLGLGSRLGALVGCSPAPSERRKRGGTQDVDREETELTSGKPDSLPKSLVQTFGAAGVAVALFKGGDMIETGARTSWSLGADNMPRNLVDLSTVMKFLAGITLGWQAARLVKGFFRSGESTDPSVLQQDDELVYETLIREQGGITPADDPLVKSTTAGLTLVLLGGGMVGALYSRIPESSFDDVLWNTRMNVAASLMGGAGLGVVLRTGGELLS